MSMQYSTKKLAENKLIILGNHSGGTCILAM